MLDPSRWPVDLSVSGTIQRSGANYDLSLIIGLAGRRAERALSSPSCETLAVTAAWLIALAMDPNVAPPAAGAHEGTQSSPASAESSPRHASEQPNADAGAADRLPQESQDVPQTPEARQPPEARGPPAPAPEASRRVQGHDVWGRVGLFAGVWGAGLPGAQASLGVRGGLGVAHAYLELRAAHVFAASHRSRLGAVSIDSQELGLSACAQWGERLRGGPCLTISGLRTHARLRAGGDDQIYWATGGAAANLAWLLVSRLELHAEAGLTLPLAARPRFRAPGGATLESASFLAGYGQLSVGVRLE